MITAILIIFGIIVFGGALGGTLWLILYTRRSAQTKKIAKEAATAEGQPFRLSYVLLPVALLLISILLSAFFYHQLPTEVATHFELNGTPDRWLSRGMAMVWVLAPQFFLTLLAIGGIWGITRMSLLFKSAASMQIKPEQILLFMGNVIAAPQLILCFTMLDIFSYNSYQRHIMPMWLFPIIILGLATIALGLFMAFIITRAKRQLVSHPSQRAKEEHDRTNAKR